jgi:hypothetical protein
MRKRVLYGMALAAGLAAATAGAAPTAIAQSTTTAQSGATNGQGYGPGYGPGWMMGPGMMGYGGYGPGWMGPGMMGYGGYGPGPWMMARGMPGWGCGPGGGWGAQQANLNLTPAAVKSNMERWVKATGNRHIKLGKVAEQDADTITADIVTTDKDALVQRYEINRHTGFIRPGE